MFRFRYKMTPRKLQIYPEGGPEARLKKLRQIVTGLIRYERVEPSFAQADEARQYIERLIYLAVKKGDQHPPTMDLADYWLLEKDLIHKLFKVLVPRYQNFNSSYTNLHKMAVEYPGQGITRGVLELKGNPWPPVRPGPRNTRFILSNVLLTAAKQDYYAGKHHSAQEALENQTNITESSPSSSASSIFSSSVDSERSSSPDSSSVDPPMSKKS